MSILPYRTHYQGDPKLLGRVAVIYGGTSAEREVSLKSGQAVLAALLESGVDAVGLDSKDGLIAPLLDERIDRAFIALHGVGGEDGRVQALLDTLNIPYTGSGYAASAIGMDKMRTKMIWQAIGIPTPDFMRLTPSTNFEKVFEKLGRKVFVKPIREGSSIGMSCVNNVDDLKNAFDEASKYDSEIIAEQAIEGREFTFSILNDSVLPIIEVIPAEGFYDYQAKYNSNTTRYVFPEDLDPIKIQQHKSTAMAAFEILGCKGWGRVDMIVDRFGGRHLLEVNTVPGMTNHSLVPMAAANKGIDFQGLVLEIIWQTVNV